MRLSGITTESVKEAVKILDQKKLTAAQLKSEYQVPVDNRLYPFKLLTETAYKIATGESLPAKTFKEYMYLIKQFERFTDFKVKVSSPILFRAEIGIDLLAIKSDIPLLQSSDQSTIDLSLLGPEINDEALKRRRFRNSMGYDDIEPGHFFFLVTDKLVYGFVHVINKVNRPLIPVKTLLFLDPGIEHGIDFSDERYPIFEVHYYGNYFKELVTALDNKDPQIITDIIQRVNT